MEKHEHIHIAKEISKNEEPWKNRAILCTAVFALFIAFSSFGAENANHHSLLAKNEATNQWAFFQAKALKERLYEFETRSLSFTKNTDPFFNEKAQLAQQLKTSMHRYQEEQNEIQNTATEKTKESELWNKKGDFFELSRIFFELGIVLNAVFLLTTRREIFWSSVGSGTLGLLFILLGTFYL